MLDNVKGKDMYLIFDLMDTKFKQNGIKSDLTRLFCFSDLPAEHPYPSLSFY